jgi:dihydrofolate synthase/folylpolyglutamate synthase
VSRHGQPSSGGLDAELEWLESHVNLEAIESGTWVRPSLERMRELLGVLGDPHLAVPVLHVTGTNGKGSTARIAASLLAARGLGVGLYTSPDLEAVNERISLRGQDVSDEELAELLASIRLAEPMLGERPTRFEILTAAAFRHFADSGVDVAVVEVGIGGRFDATNVVRSAVAAVTNVSLDHAEILGPGVEQIAWEKAGVAKAGGVLVLGVEPESLAQIFEDEARSVGSQVLRRGTDFGCEANVMAHGGRLITVSTPWARYEEVFLALHGAHQGDNAAVALAAVDALFGAPSGRDVVEEAFARVSAPGRLEVMKREPLVLLDGAHNLAGAEALGKSLAEEFATGGRRWFVVGMLRGRDEQSMLERMGIGAGDQVLVCAPPSPRAMDPEKVMASASRLGASARVESSVERALGEALAEAGDDDQIVVSGSLYLVGAARSLLH